MTADPIRILIAEDEPLVLRVFSRILAKPGRELLTASCAAEALAIVRREPRLDVALLDKNLGDGSGLDVAREIRAAHPDAQVILVTAYASVDSAIEAVRIGACDYVTKPVADFGALDLKVQTAGDRAALARDHRRLQRELAESEERYREIHDAAPDAIVTFEALSERVREVNAAAIALYGYAREELVGMPVGALFAPPAPLDLCAWCDPAPVLHRRKDGTTFSAELRPGELLLRGEALRTFMVRDVSARERAEAERRDLESQLRHAQKMDALGRLAGGLAHDLGNMLAVVVSSAEMLREGVQEGQREDLAAIEDAADRGALLVRQLMSLSRRGVSAPAVLSPNDVVADATRFLQRALGELATLEARLAPDAWDVFADRGQLGQVLLNLVVNARDAMGAGGGTVVVSTENVPAWRGGGDAVCVAVRDDGCGMDADVASRVFEPFFTTKEPGRSAGLGLAVVHGIVKQSGGDIEVESERGKGTTFRVWLPRCERGAAPATEAQGPNAARLDASLTALVVEDEAPLRALVVRALRQCGVTVVDGGTGAEALERARSHGGPIDVLVTDVVMPGLSGPDLARELSRGRPELKVVYMTGFPLAGIYPHEGPHAILHKPFKQSALLAEIRKLVSA